MESATMTTKRTSLFLLAAAAICWSHAPLHAQQSPSGTMQHDALNVLVIVLDDVGSDKLALFDDVDAGPYARTPRLDELASGGIRFHGFYVNPVCSATRALLQTGRYAFHTGMGTNADSYRLPDSELFLAELLRSGFPAERTYRSGAFGKWHI